MAGAGRGPRTRSLGARCEPIQSTSNYALSAGRELGVWQHRRKKIKLSVRCEGDLELCDLSSPVWGLESVIEELRGAVNS